MSRLSDKQVLNPKTDQIKILSDSTRYIDFDLSFDLNPNTGDINRLFDTNAVKQSVKNLVLTNFYERPFQPLLGSNIKRTLFENDTPLLRNNITQRIKQVLKRNEPRANLKTVEISSQLNTLTITIVFAVINTKEIVDVEITLNRAR